MTRPSVTLVGRRLPHNENLGLAYLRAALRGAGARVTTHYLNDGPDLARAAAAILAERPDVLGLSLADGGSSFLPLALGDAVTRAGYRGHIVAGGQFATLARDWLLSRYPWLDSVVRFAGEVPLVELAERVTRGQSADGVPGVTTRAGDGPPAPVMDATPLGLLPERDGLPEVLGHPAAHIAASRGCLGRCQYCGPAALHTLERQEGTRAGHLSAALSAAGVGGVKRREIDAVCDEMAHLWHEHGVRYFYFVDEHLLPYDEPGALEYLRLWREGLERRGLGALGIGTMLRADRLTEPVIRELARVGLVRAFVGLELATAEEGRRFGRYAPGERELGLIRAFAEHGVATVSNLMLLHPYSTAESIQAGIDLLARIPTGVFEATRMQVYHGTRLMKTMAEEGRLLGNPLRYGHTFEDPAIERFAEIFSRLRGEAFWNYSVAYRTHDAFLALGLARRLHPGRVSEEAATRLERTRQAVNRLYVDAYRRGLDLALSGGGFQDAGELVRKLRPRADELESELEAAEGLLLAVAPSASRVYAPMRSAAASVVSFALLAACGGDTTSSGSGGGSGTGGTAAVGGTSGTGAMGGTGGTSVGGGGTGGTSVGGTGGTGGTGGAPCTPAEVEAAKQQLTALIQSEAPCFSGSVAMMGPNSPQASFYAYSYAGMPSLHPCSTPGTSQAIQALETATEKALIGKIPACANTTLPDPVYVQGGGAQTDLDKMSSAIQQACSAQLTYNAQFQIVLDANGKVVDVTSDPSFAGLAACIENALSGLSFPCLASFEVCPEYVIAE